MFFKLAEKRCAAWDFQPKNVRLAPARHGRISLVMALSAAPQMEAAVDGAASCCVVQGVAQSFTAAGDARKAIGKSTSWYATICHSVLNHILLLPCLKFPSKSDHT